MDFSLTEEQSQLKASARRLLESICTKEWIDAHEAREEYPFELHQRMADIGLFGIGVPEADGGSGGGVVELAVVCEEAGRIGGPVLPARTGPPDSRHLGLTVFLVDAHSPGLTISGIPKLGHHAVQTCEIGISDVRVPADAVVGEVDGGWAALRDVLDAERIGTAGFCVGLAQRCIDMALAHALERNQFGRPVATFQAIAHMLAEMETETAAARWLTFDAASRKDRALPCSKAASI